MPDDISGAIGDYGRTVAARFATGVGEPEDNLRGPLETLLQALATSAEVADVVTAGEYHLAEERIRPDYAIHVGGALVGLMEVKAPGKGADPTKFKGHDKRQWERLSCLPNVLYTDGESFGLYDMGERVGEVVRLEGDITTACETLAVADEASLLELFRRFFRWEPIPPRRPKDLAKVAARLCRLLRSEVEEMLATDKGLRALAEDWRRILFPEATDKEFADGYAQAVTFALLLARVEGIELAGRKLRDVAEDLGEHHTLVGRALDVLTSTAVLDKLAVSVGTLQRVLAVVDWEKVSKGDPAAWLYFYESFLDDYDAALRKATGSYYTPVEAVDPMVRLVDDLLRTRLGHGQGLASSAVTVIDPGAGTGTFLFRVIDRIAETVAEEQGSGAVGPALRAAAKRLIGFELQAGPYSVAEMRLSGEYTRRGATLGKKELRFYLTDTLANPYVESEHLPAIYAPIAESRKIANAVKREEPVVVVIGNPPYKERSKGRGGWVEQGNPGASDPGPLADYMPPKEWGLGAHVKHLYNPYVYFWRWASWKVFENHPADRGVVAFITVAGFLNGPGFAGMRSHLRRTADAIWVIDCSPEGHQPEVATRIFQGVQQPVCITIAVRDGSTDDATPAPVQFTALTGRRDDKFRALASLSLDSEVWQPCSSEWKAPFLPERGSAWGQMPDIDDLLAAASPGVAPHRTWVISPSPAHLRLRALTLLAPDTSEARATLLKETRDSRIETTKAPLPGFRGGTVPLAKERPSGIDGPTRYGWRSFDRAWILPDARLIHDPRRPLWHVQHAPGQVFLTGLTRSTPTGGPGTTATALVPDLHHCRGSFGGRVWPLWLDSSGTVPNLVPGLLDVLRQVVGTQVDGPAVFAYIAGVSAHSGYVARFADELVLPGLRIPLTADAELFAKVAEVGRRALWLHTYGERFADPKAGRPSGPPKAPAERRPKVTETIPDDEAGMPETIEYDEATQTLHVGSGAIAPVEPAAWAYEVSGMKVVKRWFDRRKKDPDGKRSSPLDDMVPTTWDPDWTTELLEMLNVLTLLTDLEAEQAELLEQVVNGPLITVDDLTEAGVLPVKDRPKVEQPPKDEDRLFPV